MAKRKKKGEASMGSMGSEAVGTSQKDFMDLPTEEQIRANEAIQTTQKELLNEVKERVLERPKGKNRAKMEPKLVKTPFGDGYFLDELHEFAFTVKKTTIYQGRLFALKGDIEAL